MERLEHKIINRITYYYNSGWGWKNGKCRRLWQKYLGRIEDIAKAVEGGGPKPQYAEIFQWGPPSALWNECRLAKVIEEIRSLIVFKATLIKHSFLLEILTSLIPTTLRKGPLKSLLIIIKIWSALNPWLPIARVSHLLA